MIKTSNKIYRIYNRMIYNRMYDLAKLELQTYYVDEEGFTHFKKEYNNWVTDEMNTLFNLEVKDDINVDI